MKKNYNLGKLRKTTRRNIRKYTRKKQNKPYLLKLDILYSYAMCKMGIGRLRKSGGQKIDLISLLLNKFS